MVSSEFPQNLLGRGISLMSPTQNQAIWYFDDSTETVGPSPIPPKNICIEMSVFYSPHQPQGESALWAVAALGIPDAGHSWV